ncbi:hypothetical protein [Streptacidiphilus sp. MAP5-52]|uniref:hypothetical protein n=1 Tax=Streptacidiphilus sp. MAP5-52 TaxID=3156267 RepID=UPI00351531A6
MPLGRLPASAHDVLAQAGFQQPANRPGALRLGPGHSSASQLLRAAGAVRELHEAGVRVRNWHPPHQGGRALVRHYAWLLDDGPFPHADATTAHIKDRVGALLGSGALTASGTDCARELVDGELAVEEFTADGTAEWWFARRTSEPSRYVVLRYDAGQGLLGVTDEFAAWYGRQARRDFRAQYLRDTTIPTSRSAAARSACPARLTAAPSTPPSPPVPRPAAPAPRPR